MKILKTFDISVGFHLNGKQAEEAMRELNVFYTGDKDCNVLKEGKYVSKYPEIEKKNPKFQQSHYNANRCYRQTVKVNLMENGRLEIVK